MHHIITQPDVCYIVTTLASLAHKNKKNTFKPNIKKPDSMKTVAHCNLHSKTTEAN